MGSWQAIQKAQFTETNRLTIPLRKEALIQLRDQKTRQIYFENMFCVRQILRRRSEISQTKSNPSIISIPAKGNQIRRPTKPTKQNPPKPDGPFHRKRKGPPKKAAPLNEFQQNVFVANRS